MLVVTVGCGKGGVGKTTTAVNLAHGFALRGQRTLLIDTDPYAYASLWFDHAHEQGTNAVLTDKQPELHEVREGMWLLPASLVELTEYEKVAYRREDPPSRMAHKLRGYAAGYDVVVVDTPQRGYLLDGSVAMADTIVIPMTVEEFGGHGTAYVTGARQNMAANSTLGFLPTMYDDRVLNNRETHKMFADFAVASNAVMFDAVPIRFIIKTMLSARKTVWDYKGRGYSHQMADELQSIYGKVIDQVLRTEYATA